MAHHAGGVREGGGPDRDGRAAAGVLCGAAVDPRGAAERREDVSTACTSRKRCCPTTSRRIRARRPVGILLWDDRGHFTRAAHRDGQIGLGTLSVRGTILRALARTASTDAASPDGHHGGRCRDGHIDRTTYPTVGPRHRYAHVLLIEKEGFQQLFKQRRHRAALRPRHHVEQGHEHDGGADPRRNSLPGVRFLVFHDLDKAGFSILGTLTRSTRRYHFRRRADIVDLGIRLDDVQAEQLDAEPVPYTKDPRGEPPAERRDRGRDPVSDRRQRATRRTERVRFRSPDRVARSEVAGARRDKVDPR